MALAAACGAALMTVAGAASAAPTLFANATGLTGAFSTVTFDDVTPADGTVLSNEYQADGITLVDATMNPQDGFLPRNYIGNFNRGTQFPDLRIMFNTVVTSAAIELVTNFGTSTLNAYLDGDLVGTGTVTTSTASGAWYGFTSGAFDSLQIIAPGNAAMEIGTVEFAGGAPEPAAWALMITGFVGAGAVLRRQRKVAAAA